MAGLIAAGVEALTRDPLTEGVEVRDPQIVRHHGESVDGRGCRYSGAREVGPDDVPEGYEVLEREVAHDPVECVLVMQRAFVPAGTVLDEDMDDESAGSDGGLSRTSPAQPSERVRSQPNASTEGGADELSTSEDIVVYRTDAYLKVWYEDPVFIDVTSNLVAVRWFHGGCVGQHPTYHWFNRGWFEESGWYEDGWAWWYGWDCGKAYTDGYGFYINQTFCERWVNPLEGSPTYVDHWQTYIEGRANNTYWVYWEAYKWGGCHDLLRFGQAYGSPYYP